MSITNAQPTTSKKPPIFHHKNIVYSTIGPSTDWIRDDAKGQCHSRRIDSPITLTSHALTVKGTSDISSLLLLFLFLTDPLTHPATDKLVRPVFYVHFSVCPASGIHDIGIIS